MSERSADPRFWGPRYFRWFTVLSAKMAPMVGFCGFPRGEPQTSEAEVYASGSIGGADGGAHEGRPCDPLRLRRAALPRSLHYIVARRRDRLNDGLESGVRLMPNVLTHKASELKAQTRVALEAELGRSLQDDEEVSIMVFVPHDAPMGKARAEAGNRLRAYLQRMDAKSQGAATEQTEDALNEALRHARPGYRERD